MFIPYGDPTSHQAPTVSIRDSTGHHQPALVTEPDVRGADVRVVEAAWIESTGASGGTGGYDFVAKVNLVWYSCTLWTRSGTLISATAKSQPWIWAWNPDQEFPVISLSMLASTCTRIIPLLAALETSMSTWSTL